MFTIVRLKHVLTKASKNIINLQIRGFLPKQSSGDQLRGRFQLQSPSFQKIQNSKVTPEGYSVVYVSPIIPHLNFGHVLLAVSWPLIITYFYKCFQDPEWYNKKMVFFHSSKGVLGLCILTVPFALHWFLLRNVRVVFKKGDQYKTLIYGFFGPFRKIYIDHGKYSYEKRPGASVFHYLKSKRIIVFQENFYSDAEYYGLIFTQNEEQSYL